MAKPFYKRRVDIEMAVVVLFGVPIIAMFAFINSYLTFEDEPSLAFHPVQFVESYFRKADIARFTSVDDAARYVRNSRAVYGPTRSVDEAPFDGTVAMRLNQHVASAENIHRADTPQQIGASNGIIVAGSVAERGSTVYFASPPEGASAASRIPDSGLFLTAKKTLVVVSERSMTGYDISRAEFPSRQWQMDIASGVTLQSAEIEDGTLYILTAHRANQDPVCPYTVAVGLSGALHIDCTKVYRPTRVMPADVLYTLLAIDSVSGSVERMAGLLAPRAGAAVRLSPSSAYVAYSVRETPTQLYGKFFSNFTRDLLPYGFIRSAVQSEHTVGNSGDASSVIAAQLDAFEQKLAPNERNLLTQQLAYRFSQYLLAESRNQQHVLIARIRLKDFAIQAGGSVGGRLLDADSMDVSGDILSAVTSIDSTQAFPSLPESMRVNALEVSALTKDLRSVTARKTLDPHSVGGLELSATRAYVSGWGTEPLTLLDLSAARRASDRAVLPIVGTHWRVEPLDAHTVLAISGQGQQTAVALLNIQSNHQDSTTSAILIDEPWAAVNARYGAAFMDPNHGFFFLPGRNRAYVFSLQPGGLRLLQTIELRGATASASMGGYLYVTTDRQIVVVDEQSWQTVRILQRVPL